MQIITAAAIKGGTGKSTTSAALLQAGANIGARCLAIDLDPQCNLSRFIGANLNKPGARELLHGEKFNNVIQSTPQGISAITAAPNLAAETTKPGSGKRLKNALEPLVDFDLVIIDTPPQMGELTYNALTAATGLIIPLEADNSSLQGLYNIVDIAQQIQKKNSGLNIIGSVLTRFDARPKLNRYLRDIISEKGAEIGVPLLTEIRPTIAIKEAQAFQKSLYEYAPNCTAARDYKKLFDMIYTP